MEQTIDRNSVDRRISDKRTVDKKVYDVEIAGMPLKLKSAHSQEVVQDLVSYVNSKVCEAMPLTKSGSVQTAAILASLNIAEELVLLKRKAKSDLDRLENKARQVLTQLESSQVPKTGLEVGGTSVGL